MQSPAVASSSSPVSGGGRKRRRGSSSPFVGPAIEAAAAELGSPLRSSLEHVVAVADVRVSIGHGGASGAGDGGGDGRRRRSGSVEALAKASSDASSAELSRERLPELGGAEDHRLRPGADSPISVERSLGPLRPPVKMTDHDQEELDYYIMFPSFPAAATTATAAGSKIPNDDDEETDLVGADHREEFVFVYEEDKRPVVVLLGWAGCQDKYLAKYSAIYEEKR